MRPSVTDHKIVYIRFHKRIDALLDDFSRKTGMKRAASVLWIQKQAVDRLLSGGKSPELITREDLGLSGLEETYFIALGRGREGSMLGRGIQLTVDKSEERKLTLIAMQCEISTRDLRTAFLVHYFHGLGMI